jgi:hypothetical protein
MKMQEDDIKIDFMEIGCEGMDWNWPFQVRIQKWVFVLEHHAMKAYLGVEV